MSESTREDRERAARFYFPGTGGLPPSVARYVESGGTLGANVRSVGDLADLIAFVRAETTAAVAAQARREALNEAATACEAVETRLFPERPQEPTTKATIQHIADEAKRACASAIRALATQDARLAAAKEE